MATIALRKLIRSGRRFGPTWRCVYNVGPSLAYWFNKRPLFEPAAQVLTDLNRDGVAITSVQTLLGQSSCYDELCAGINCLQSHLSEQIAMARAGSSAAGKKTFNLEYLGNKPVLDPDGIYARFALQDGILQVANAYLGMYTRLRYFNVWHTFPTQSQARESQLWHRDREDRYILKMFLYLSDVSEGAGPLTYAAGSHLKGKMRREPAYFLEADGVKRSNDEQMAEAASPETWIKATGAQGTIVFADTHGYHKGGLARERDRLMYLCMFTSPASESQELLKRSMQINSPEERKRAFALAAPKRGPWCALTPRFKSV